MGIMDLFSDAADLLSDAADFCSEKVQNFTGETERREAVRELKNDSEELKKVISTKVDQVNNDISNFNDGIDSLNEVRKDRVENIVIGLAEFLSIFGKVKSIGEYVDENEHIPEKLPTEKFLAIEDYIERVDFSQSKVFKDTLTKTVYQTKKDTQNLNIQLKEKLEELKTLKETMLNELKDKQYIVLIEIEVCDAYIQVISYISEFIENTIMPELEGVEAFFQALCIKDEVIANNNPKFTPFKFDIDILYDSVYEKHYYFIKNTLVFYVFSCKVYNTKILTNLLNNKATKDDLEVVKMYSQESKAISQKIDSNLILS
jgi:hypothetical protein